MKKLLVCALMIASMSVVHSMESARLFAQEGKTTAKKERRGPLPYYYGKLGVDDEQREQLYNIQDSYEAKLKTLRDEMKKLLQEREQEMEAALSPGQKLRLQELHAEAKKDEGKKPVAKKQTEETTEVN